MKTSELCEGATKIKGLRLYCSYCQWKKNQWLDLGKSWSSKKHVGKLWHFGHVVRHNCLLKKCDFRDSIRNEEDIGPKIMSSNSIADLMKMNIERFVSNRQQS